MTKTEMSTDLVEVVHGVANGLFPLAGETVETAKVSLRDSLNIPFFSDAIVNGDAAFLTRVLKPQDRLEFRKRFGIKGSGDRPQEEIEADAILLHYPEFVQIASEVNSRKLPSEKAVELTIKLVAMECDKRFGRTTDWEVPTNAEIVKRLIALEKEIATIRPSFQKQLNEAEQNIVEALGDATLTGEILAKKAGYPYNSNIKATLSSLVKRDILNNNGRGYFAIGRAKPEK